MTRTVGSGLQPVRDALELEDPLGVLSVYVGAREVSTPGSAALREVEVELSRLRRLVESSWTTDPAPARAALDDAEARVRGATLSGEASNLALFAALGRGERVAFTHVGAVPTRAVFGPRADVRPLVLALEEARHAGVALVSAEGVRLLEWAPGVMTELWEERLPELEGPELVGPAQGHPRGAPGAAPGFLVGQQRDLYESRMRTELERLVLAAGRRAGEEAQERDWRELALAGDDRLTPFLARGIASDVALEIAPVPRLERWRSLGELALGVAPAITAVRARRAEALAERALAEADGAGRGARGLRETLAALDEARVDTLLVAADRPIAGRTSASGRLAAPGDVPPGLSEGDLTEDAMLADAMIARALDTGATVVVLGPDTATPLGEDDVAALLRY